MLATNHSASAPYFIWLLLAALACAIPAPLPEPRSATRPIATSSAAGLIPTQVPTSPAPAFSGDPVTGAAAQLSPLNAFAPFNAIVHSPQEAAVNRSDLEDLLKLETLDRLSPEQREIVLAEGFVISTRSFDSFAAAYAYGSQQKLPAFITTDTILDAFQIVVDITWQRSEGQFLAADLMALSHAMVAVSQQQWEEAEDDSTAQAAQRNLAFFAVGSRLLDPQFTLPPLVSSIASDELTLIEQGGRFISPLFGGQYDYNGFTPSIHYAKDEALSRYFRALTWLSQPFPAPPSLTRVLPPGRHCSSPGAYKRATTFRAGNESSNRLSISTAPRLPGDYRRCRSRPTRFMATTRRPLIWPTRP